MGIDCRCRCLLPVRVSAGLVVGAGLVGVGLVGVGVVPVFEGFCRELVVGNFVLELVVGIG